jgi:hypothetical protein
VQPPAGDSFALGLLVFGDLCHRRSGLSRLIRFLRDEPCLRKLVSGAPRHATQYAYSCRMEPDPKPGFVTRVLQFLGLRRRPPDIGVREPRRPKPSASGGAVTLDLPETEDRK